MKKLISLIASTSLVAAVPAVAQTAPGLGDLIGVRGSSVENELGSRGYVFAKNLGAAAMWWNGTSSRCVSVAIDNGRVASIQSASANDCGKQSGNTAAGIIAGAAAVGLIAALASHHDKSGGRNNHAAYNVEYERGYHDGLFGAHYDRADSEGYHSGFLAGEAEAGNRRAANTRVVRSGPATARQACIQRLDQLLGFSGSATAVDFFDYGQGNFEVTVASGHRRFGCSVTASGQITDFIAR